jgi:hypothetical protein
MAWLCRRHLTSALVVLQICLTFATALAVMIKAPTFGSDAACNVHRRLTLHFLFAVVDMEAINAGRVVCAALLVLGLAASLGTMTLDCSHVLAKTPQWRRRLACLAIAGTAALIILNAETFIAHNHPEPGAGDWMSYGQVRTSSR